MIQHEQGFGIYHDLVIEAPIEKVFAAISEPAHLINWWPLRCEGEPILGATYHLFFTSQYDWYGTVSKLKTTTSFHIKMSQADTDWNPTTFGFELSEESGRVHVQFSHVNWTHRNEHFRIASFCWAMLLKGLKEYVEKGIVIPFEERS